MASYRAIRNVRRVSQIVFLAVFFWLLLATFYHGIVEEGGQVDDAIPYPVSIFLQIDPLAALSTLLATGWACRTPVSPGTSTTFLGL